MTEEEAARRLCELLNEIEEAGFQVAWSSRGRDQGLDVGAIFIAEPPCEDEPWEVML